VNPPEVAVEIKGQRAVTAVDGAPVEITLSNDDLNWLSDNTFGDYVSCGPCKIVDLGRLPLGRPAVVLVEWSGNVPIHFWIDEVSWDPVKLGEIIPAPGQTATTTIPVQWRGNPLTLVVGLPYGSRFPAGSPPISVRIEVRT
jgi:hypothetical protein